MPSLPRELRDLARALVETAMRDAAVPEVLGDLRTVTDAFTSDKLLISSLSESTVPLETRQDALKKALEKKIHPYVINALLALQKRNLLHLVEAYLHSALTLAQRSAGYAEATVTTALPLTEAQRKEILNALSRSFGGTLNLREQVDPDIIGGLIADVGDKRIDASVKGRINRLKQSLIA